MSSQEKNNATTNASYIMGTVMFVVYLLFGIALLFTNFFEASLGKNKNILGIVVILYGAFRFWMSWRLKKSKTNSQKSEAANGILGFGYYFGMIMIIVYLLAGVMLIFTPVFEEYLGTFKLFLGVLLIVYALFRVWATLKIRKFRNE
ncbi:MAG: hypothetical protein ACOYNH_00845 [Bacteroidia bacterium]|jgi:hypothetical protein